MKKLFRSFAAFFLLTSSLFSWTPEELLSMKKISDVQFSPDNQSIVFVVTELAVKEGKQTFFSRIYKGNVCHSSESSPFSSADFSSFQPRWSPDGKWIAFLSKCNNFQNLYLISSQGGEAIALTNVNQNIQNFSWSPNSQKIAFVMPDEMLAHKNAQSNEAYEYKQHKFVNRLWVIDIASPNPKALTTDEYCIRDSDNNITNNLEFDWSPDSQDITFAYSPSKECDDVYVDSSLATINLATKIVVPWEKRDRFEAAPRYSPNGQMIAYVSSDTCEKFSFNTQITISSLDGKQRKVLAPTYNEGAFISGPNHLGWSHDGNEVLFFEPKGTKFHLVFLNVDGKTVREFDCSDNFFKEPTLSPDKKMIGFVAQSLISPPEAYVSPIDHFNPTKISSFNESFHSQPIIHTETLKWESEDGLTIEGLLTYPVDYQLGKPYPLLVILHGGPMGCFDESFVGSPCPYPVASFAENGFLVFRPNPRGSTGYGKKFRCANYGDWGGMDYVDIMTGVDVLIAKKIVNPQRMGVMGWSYGGYLTAWIVGQTSKFKAASIGAGVCNLVSMNGTSDLHRFLTDYLGDYQENQGLYEKLSPLNYIYNVTTPCLIQHGTEDKRVPVSQSYEFYHALDRAGKKPSLILYPGMGHAISDPKLLLDAMNRNLNWFKQHLLEKN